MRAVARPAAGRMWDMGTLKALVGIVVIVGVFYAVWEIVPPELSNYSFQDDLRNIAMMGSSNPHETDQAIAQSVIKKAEEHQITLTPDQVTVQRIGTPGAPAVYVAADYSVPVQFPGYSFTLHFTPSSGNKGF
ncbi:MAG TPA: hypothetical protein VGS05_04130 [Candidatus Sulfotelmatobacter sp.]|nr:hypothetical protein [Candidatus Sulfotelmatobacter sp.]